MSLVWNRFPFVHSRAEEKFAWEGTCGSKSMQTKGFILNPGKVGGIDGQLNFHNQLPNAITTHDDANGFLPPKTRGTTAEFLNQGMSCFHNWIRTVSSLHMLSGCWVICHQSLAP